LRKVRKDYNAPPMSLMSGRRYYDDAINKIIVNKAWFDKASKLYSGDPVKRKLDLIYNRKCAFCELKPLGSPPQVEHYRPKDKVNGIVHTGYYWLAYEWSNLLLICATCNSTKGNHFPIVNVASRVMAPTMVGLTVDLNANQLTNHPLALEGAVLINPEFDTPMRHLAFAPDGKLLFLDMRGSISITRYNLNRDELYSDGRKKIIEDFELKLMRRLQRFIDGLRSASDVVLDIIDLLIESIIYPISKEASFTSFYQAILLNFEEMIVGRFPAPKIKKILRISYLKAVNSL
jgi:uncharacterized protein (TIGR02646 family)